MYISVPYIFPTLNTGICASSRLSIGYNLHPPVGLLHLSHIGLIPLVSRIRCDNCPHWVHHHVWSHLVWEQRRRQCWVWEQPSVQLSSSAVSGLSVACLYIRTLLSATYLFYVTLVQTRCITYQFGVHQFWRFWRYLYIYVHFQMR